jgi:hypothetical protein
VKKAVLTIFFICLFPGSLIFAQISMEGYSAILTERVVDLRATSQLPPRSGNEPGRNLTPDNLDIGSIFLTVDNKARKVVDIYEHNGKTIIETIEPRPEEVFLGLYVPDFEVELGRENVDVSSIADGVTLLPPGAEKKDMLSSSFTVPAEQDRSVTWMETDPANDGVDILSFNVDIPLWSSDLAGAIKDELEKKKDDAKDDANQDSEEDGVSSETGGKPEADMGAEGEIRLVGTMRLAKPTFYGGVDMPSIRFSWISKWWGGYFTIRFEDGYAKAGVRAAQQFDFKLTGTISLSAELKIPLYAVTFTYQGVTGTVGFYAKVSLDGKISLAVECSEYTTHEVGAKCRLVWPFIPVRFTGTNNTYLNFAFRPIISAEAELKAGLYLGAELEVAGITIVGAEAGGGAYILVQGYMEPMGIMGYDTNIGMYGNFNDWILDLYAEAGAYAEVTAEILTVDLTLWDQKWPFWEWHQSWEL